MKATANNDKINPRATNQATNQATNNMTIFSLLTDKIIKLIFFKPVYTVMMALKSLSTYVYRRTNLSLPNIAFSYFNTGQIKEAEPFTQPVKKSGELFRTRSTTRTPTSSLPCPTLNLIRWYTCSFPQLGQPFQWCSFDNSPFLELLIFLWLRNIQV